MVLAGDELGHTQLGNNNAYCQDSMLTWLNWDLAPDQRELLEFVRGLIKLRKQNPVFRRRHFFQGGPIHGSMSKTSTGSRLPGLKCQTRRILGSLVEYPLQARSVAVLSTRKSGVSIVTKSLLKKPRNTLNCLKDIQHDYPDHG